MFTISNKSEYGLLLIGELVGKTKYTPLSLLLEKLPLPKRFIARIAAILANKGILDSREGKFGGYKIKTDLHTISLGGFLRILGEDLNSLKCQNKKYRCSYVKSCRHKFFFNKIMGKIFSKELERWTLADIFNNE